MFEMEKIPKTITYEITKHLNYWQILNFLATCRKFRRLCQCDEFWSALLKYHYPYHIKSSSGFKAKNVFKARTILTLCASRGMPRPSKIKKFGHFLLYVFSDNFWGLINIQQLTKDLYTSSDDRYKPIILLYPIIIIFDDRFDYFGECYISFNVETGQYYGDQELIFDQSGCDIVLTNTEVLMRLSGTPRHGKSGTLVYEDLTHHITFDPDASKIIVRSIHPSHPMEVLQF